MRFGGSQSRPQWLVVGLGLAIVIATYLFLIVTRPTTFDQGLTGNSTTLLALAGYLIGALLIIWGAARQFTTSTYALIPIAIAINIVMGQITGAVGIWLYLDSIGTILVAVLVGPLAGAVTGGLANIIWGLTLNPVVMPFAVVAIAIGLMAGTFAQRGLFKRFALVIPVGLCIGIVAALMSSPLAAFIYGGVTGTGSDTLVAFFRAYGSSLLQATTLQGLFQDTIDKFLSCLIVYFIIRGLPPRMRVRFSQPGTADKLPQ